MDHESKTYPIYSELSLSEPKSIRLLTILPGNHDDTIELKLEIADLDQKPNYHALSYVWNPPALHDSPLAKVICNGIFVEVTPNLGAALRRLRPSRPSTCSNLGNAIGSKEPAGDFKLLRRIWIDALCVNQQDLDERSDQVSLMKYIYDGAEKVIVWLGEDDGFALEAISLIQRLARIREREKLRNEPQSNQGDRYHPEDDIPKLDDEIWDALYLFYSNNWFRRIWVLQEVARENALMIMGHHEVSHRDVGLCAEWMVKPIKNHYVVKEKYPYAIFPSLFIRIMKEGLPFLEMLQISSQMEAR